MRKIQQGKNEKERQDRRREDVKGIIITAENGGLSISHRKHKFEEMNKTRSGGGPADSLESTLSPREESSVTRSLEALKKWTVLTGKSISGRKSKLKSKPVNEICDKENTSPDVNVPAPNNGRHTTHTLTHRSATHQVQHRNTELLSVNKSSDNPDETLTLTVDSGAAENVMGQHMAPRPAIKPSLGSRSGVQYTTAAGGSIPNRGGNEVKVCGDKQGTEVGTQDACHRRHQSLDVSVKHLRCGT